MLDVLGRGPADLGDVFLRLGDERSALDPFGQGHPVPMCHLHQPLIRAIDVVRRGKGREDLREGNPAFFLDFAGGGLLEGLACLELALGEIPMPDAVDAQQTAGFIGEQTAGRVDIGGVGPEGGPGGLQILAGPPCVGGGADALLHRVSANVKRCVRQSTSYLRVMSLSMDERRKVAESLLRIKAIQLAPEDPFTWASGLRSPIYCDNRMALSHPAVRTHIRQ